MTAAAPPRLSRLFTTVVGTVVAIAALHYAGTVVVPIIAGLFIAVVARPLQTALASRMPRPLRWVGLLVTMLVVIASIAGVITVAGLAVRSVVSEFQERRPVIEQQLGSLRERAARAGIELPQGGGKGSGGGQSAEPPSGGQASAGPSGGAGGVLTKAVEGVGGLLLALAVAALVLAETEEGRRRIAHLGKENAGRRALDAIDEAAPAFRRYVWVKTLTSALTGTCTGLAAWALGIPLAWVWGLLAFLFEYVPTVGSVLAIAPPVLMALADGGPTRAAIAFGVIGTLQVILGNVVDPRLEGKMMEISPTGVLVSVVFWGWVWGPVGALLAVPLTVAIVIACRHIPGKRGVATLIAGDGVDDERRD